MTENNETNKTDENKSIFTYLDFIIFELNRSINRKNILENKAYLLGTALVAFISFNNNFFGIVEDICKIQEKKYLIIFLLKIISIAACIISFVYIYLTINLSDNSYLEEFDISVRREKKKIEQEEEILEYHKETLKIINKRCEEKSKNLKIAIKFALLFFLVYFLFMLGGEK